MRLTLKILIGAIAAVVLAAFMLHFVSIEHSVPFGILSYLFAQFVMDKYFTKPPKKRDEEEEEK